MLMVKDYDLVRGAMMQSRCIASWSGHTEAWLQWLQYDGSMPIENAEIKLGSTNVYQVYPSWSESPSLAMLSSTVAVDSTGIPSGQALCRLLFCVRLARLGESFNQGATRSHKSIGEQNTVGFEGGDNQNLPHKTYFALRFWSHPYTSLEIWNRMKRCLRFSCRCSFVKSAPWARYQ